MCMDIVHWKSHISTVKSSYSILLITGKSHKCFAVFCNWLWLRFKSTPLSKLATGLLPGIRDASLLPSWTVGIPKPPGVLGEISDNNATHLHHLHHGNNLAESHGCVDDKSLAWMYEITDVNKESRTNEPQIARFEFNIQNHWTFFRANLILNDMFHVLSTCPCPSWCWEGSFVSLSQIPLICANQAKSDSLMIWL